MNKIKLLQQKIRDMVKVKTDNSKKMSAELVAKKLPANNTK